ncbi:hypothetical protein [Propionivibrio sp.]|uniref:hypothetical protein n=1 Tax=Propionivibrio sp. TaxID=2212460 RepID=UPI0025F3D994|nr:hypothetical protein [Propionivibrio sp.]MBK7357505.1 hypothetical protein [Propionivibrio sp.]
MAPSRDLRAAPFAGAGVTSVDYLDTDGASQSLTLTDDPLDSTTLRLPRAAYGKGPQPATYACQMPCVCAIRQRIRRGRRRAAKHQTWMLLCIL